MKHTYHLEALHEGQWLKVFESTKEYCLGYMEGCLRSSPRPAFRVVRSDGEEIHRINEGTELKLGVVAGHPTIAQVEQAIERALELVARLREQQQRHTDMYGREQLDAGTYTGPKYVKVFKQPQPPTAEP